MAAKLVSMRIPKAEREKMSVPSIATDGPVYPYGLSISLENEALEKLGLTKLPKVGSSIVVIARADVTSVSEHERTDGDGVSTNRSVSLQITDLCLEDEGSKAAEATEALYK